MIFASSLALGFKFDAKEFSRSVRQFRIGANYPLRRFLPARIEFPTRTGQIPRRLTADLANTIRTHWDGLLLQAGRYSGSYLNRRFLDCQDRRRAAHRPASLDRVAAAFPS